METRNNKYCMKRSLKTYLVLMKYYQISLKSHNMMNYGDNSVVGLLDQLGPVHTKTQVNTLMVMILKARSVLITIRVLKTTTPINKLGTNTKNMKILSIGRTPAPISKNKIPKINTMKLRKNIKKLEHNTKNSKKKSNNIVISILTTKKIVINRIGIRFTSKEVSNVDSIRILGINRMSHFRIRLRRNS